jgi:hypothetical protein
VIEIGESEYLPISYEAFKNHFRSAETDAEPDAAPAPSEADDEP